MVAEGDLETPLPEIRTENETMILAESTKVIVERMNEIIGDASYLLAEMANGNFAVHSKIGENAYVGAFKALLISIRTLNGDLSATLKEIHEASAQVEAGASQMAIILLISLEVSSIFPIAPVKSFILSWLVLATFATTFALSWA